MSKLLSVVCALALYSTATFRGAEAVAANELSFPMIRAQVPRQWTLQIATGKAGSDVFKPLVCPNPVVGACTGPDTYMPFVQDANDVLRINYTLSAPNNTDGTLKTYNGGVPTKIELRACYSAFSFTDRAWRKKNKPYPRLTNNCPRTLFETAFKPSSDPEELKRINSGIALRNFNTFDEIPTATWFTMLWVYCGSTVCDFASTEGNATATPPVPGNFFETKVEMGITSGLRAASIIMAIIGPSIFIVYYIADQIKYKKTGKPLLLF